MRYLAACYPGFCGVDRNEVKSRINPFSAACETQQSHYGSDCEQQRLHWLSVSRATYFRMPAGAWGLFLQIVPLHVTAALATIAGNFLMHMANLPLLPCSKTQRRVEFLPRPIFQVAKRSTPIGGIFRRVTNTTYWDLFNYTGWTVSRAESDCPGSLRCTEIKDVQNFEITGISNCAPKDINDSCINLVSDQDSEIDMVIRFVSICPGT